MAVFKCGICGYEYDERKEGGEFGAVADDWVCPVCKASKDKFTEKENGEDAGGRGAAEVDEADNGGGKNPLAYPSEYARSASEAEKHMSEIHTMAVSGKPIIEAMSTSLPVISWEDVLILGAQLNPAPLDEHDPVKLKTVIGRKAQKPMELRLPVYVSHMSFGALSREMKIALAKGSAASGTAICSGEGGILPEEKQEAYKYIFEYVPNLYSISPDNLRSADAIEIKIGQGTKPGMGGHLPGDKVTKEISVIRNKPMGQDVISPSKFPNLKTKDDLKNMVDWLRDESEGRPIGVKIAAGHIERDMEWIAYANPDFVTVDGRGGATGASPKSLKDSGSLPTIYALYRAKKFIRENRLDMELVITGGLRVPSDFAKAIAMGADAVAIASAALMAAACQQYRICNSGLCPVGAATQDPELRKRLSVENSAKRLHNYLEVTRQELEMFARVTGHEDIHELDSHDLCTTNREISEFTDIAHA